MSVIVVVDASNLQRNLYLVSQLIELGRPLVVALNMMDIAERRGLNVSPEKLAAGTGRAGDSRRRVQAQRIAELKAAIAQRSRRAAAGLAAAGGDAGRTCRRRRGAGDPATARDDSQAAARSDRYHAIAERLLIGDHAADIRAAGRQQAARRVAARIGAPTASTHWASIRCRRTSKRTIAGSKPVVDARRGRITDSTPPSDIAMRPPISSPRDAAQQRSPSSRRDPRHKVWGLLIFAGIMGAAVRLALLAGQADHGRDPERHRLRSAQLVTGHMADGPLKRLISDGIFNGVGTVVVFVPQIALLFLFLAILEDTGYLARAAFLMDRLLSKVGLHGKSFIPLLSSFACAIPGIMATRTIENRHDRLATILVAPFMSCSARLPVYTLLIGAFFAAYGALAQAGIMLACYALGILAAAGTAWVFKRTLIKGPATSFILELPSTSPAGFAGRPAGVDQHPGVPHQGRHDDLLPERDPLGDGVLSAASRSQAAASKRRRCADA